MMRSRIATPKADTELRKTFETEDLAKDYCHIMAFTSRNTTGWHVEPNGSRFDAVSQIKTGEKQ